MKKTDIGRTARRLVSLALAAVFCVLPLASCKKGDAKSDDDDKVYTAGDIAMSTENFTISRAEVSYIFYQNYNEFVNNNSETVNMYNIDTNSSLKTQEYHDGITWFRYFADATVDYMKFVLVFCEAARADGLTLDSDDKEAINKAVSSYGEYAERYGYTVEGLFEKTFNADVNEQVLREYLEKDALAHKYYYDLLSSYEYSDSEMEAFAEENPYRFKSIDYIYYTFDEDNDEGAKESAAQLAAINDAEQFKAYIENYAENEHPGDEVFSIDKYTVKYAARNEYSDFSKWAFDGAHAGETYTVSNDVDGTYSVYLLVSEPSIQEYRTRDFRFIKEYVSGHPSYQKTLEYVNGLLDTWKEGEATEDSFAALADTYNKAADNELGGGLYMNASKSDTTLPEELKQWLYEDGRAAGDTTVVKGDAYYMAVYYIGEDEVQWKLLAKQGLNEKHYQEDYEKLSEKYAVTTDDAVINSLDA